MCHTFHAIIDSMSNVWWSFNYPKWWWQNLRFYDIRLLLRKWKCILKKINKNSQNENNELVYMISKNIATASVKKRGSNKHACNNANKIKNTYKEPVNIYRISWRWKYSPANAFIRLLTLRYKRQDRVANGVSERIKSDLCEDTLRVKRIIMVWRSLLKKFIK